MERVVYIAAVILIILWIVGFFLYSLGALVHLLLLLAFAIIVLRLLTRRKRRPDDYPRNTRRV